MDEIPPYERMSIVCPHCYHVFAATTIGIVPECPICRCAIAEKDIVYGLNEHHSYLLACAIANEMRKKREVEREIDDVGEVK